MNIKRKLIRLNWFISSQFGIDLKITALSVRGLPRYIRDLIHFRLNYKGRLEFAPCLHDWYQEGGSTKSEYFWQDLLVARMIFESNPEKHVDIGSRIDGFVAHVASFREVEVFDVRPVSTSVPGLIFKQADFTQTSLESHDYCDSISCLHALEHFGLGRYGDVLDPLGYSSGFANMSRMLRSKGKFYLSVPVGIERIEFNANRIFDPNTIASLALENLLQISSMIAILPDGGFSVSESNQEYLNELANHRYTLVIFTFVKI